MAITSISRIQHRRGIKTDLPANLYEGELGWCLDTRELYIGNGPTTNGNSQILSQYSDNDQLITHVYRGSASIPATTNSSTGTPIARPLGAILDDWISVKDYGAMGDGVTDDTAAIQRAINDRWATQDFSCIRFPAGVYLVSNTIYVLPNVSLIGEGSQATILKMFSAGSSTTCVISTADSIGQTGTSIGLSNAVLPNNITIQGITIDTTQNSSIDGIKLQRSSEVLISDLSVIGNWTTGQNPQMNSNVPMTNGISIETLGSLYLADVVKIRNYSANGFANGIYCNDVARYITIDVFDINNCFRGVVFEANIATNTNGPRYVRVTNGSFRNIDFYGLVVSSSNPGIVSGNNTYDTVGNVYNSPPIFFGTSSNNCSSINDTFSNINGNLIEIGNPISNIIISPQKVSTAIQDVTPVGPVELLDNSTNMSTGIEWNSSINNTLFLHYSIKRGTSRRAGKLTVISDGTSVDFDDEGVDLNPDVLGTVGVTWSTTVVDGIISLMYNTTSTGTNGNLWYTQMSWFM